MEYSEFTNRAAEIEATDADLEIQRRVASLLEAADDDLSIVARYVQGRVFPGHAERTLDIGPRLCYEAIARAAGPNVDVDDVESRVASVGDVGAVAGEFDFGDQQGLASFGTGETNALTVGEVHETLSSLAAAAGPGSQDEKVTTLFGLFNRTDSSGARYLARLVLGEMRIGVGRGTVRDAIAAAFDVPVDRVERALQMSNDYGLVAETARSPDESLDGISLTIGRPVQAMLAQAGSVDDALTDWDETVVETKYDGARVQIHVSDTIEIFSRNMERVTDALPDVVDVIEANLGGPAILDGEVLAVDDDGTPLPFQEVLRRFRREHDVEAARSAVSLELVVFDCLAAGGDNLVDHPLVERRTRLEAIWDGPLAEYTRTDDRSVIERHEESALSAGHEGIMLKNPESNYTPGRRGKGWLKRKPDVETLDLVVTGATWGEGRRADLLGTYELSARSEDGYATIGNVATGITDEELEMLSDRVERSIVTEDGQTVDVEPSIVVEVGYEEIQESPTYSSGYALRFPRFVGVRDDLEPAAADTLERIRRLANS